MKNEAKNKAGGFLGGIIVLIIGIAILWNNEGRSVKTQNAINEAKKSYQDVVSTAVDSQNEGKVIATNGEMNIGDTVLSDTKFGIHVNAAKLEKHVDMYQWVESCETDDNDNKNCTYTKEWKDTLENSNEFYESGHTNPTMFKNANEEFLAKNIKVGAFVLPEALLKRLSCDKEIGYDELTKQYQNQVEGYVVNNNYITNSVDVNNPQIGDERVSYKYLEPGLVSMLGVQSGNSLVAFTGKQGKDVFVVRKGVYTGRQMLEQETKSNKTMKWILRVLGIILVYAGIGSLFSPLTNLTDKVPVLGKLVGFSTGLITFVLGTVISILVIAIAWFRFRPILSIILIAIAVALIIFLNIRGKNKKQESNTVKEPTE